MTTTAKRRGLCAALVLALTLTACTAAGGSGVSPAPSSAPASAAPASAAPTPLALTTSAPHVAKLEEDDGTWSAANKYTSADYALLESFHPKDWEKMTLAAFNAGFHVGDEAQFHKVEDALHRLFCSLPKTDPLYTFLDTTVSNSWDVCRRQHYYQSCDRNGGPSNSGEATYERCEDVFGDKVPVAYGCCDFWYAYTIPDEAALTVGERDAFFRGLDEGMNSFLSAQKEDALKDSKAMEHTLGLELQRLTGVLGSDQIYASTCGVSYYWERMYD